MNEKVDVYSFGVVLLELVTGREPNYGDEHTSLAEWAWKQSLEEKSITDCLDKQVMEPSVVEQMIKVFKLGLGCTNESSQNRPSMKEVLQVLRRCSPSSNGEKKNDGGEFDVAPLLGSTNTYLSSYRRSKKVVDSDLDDSLVYSV